MKKTFKNLPDNLANEDEESEEADDIMELEKKIKLVS